MNGNILMIVILIVLSLGGYGLAFWMYQNNLEMEKKLLEDDMNKIGLIDEELKSIREAKSITVEELKESRERINKLIKEAEDRDTSTLDYEDAIRIIGDLK